MNNETKVITGPQVRWDYVRVWEPVSFPGRAPRYEVTLLIPKLDTETVDAIYAAIETAYEGGLARLQGDDIVAPELSELWYPLRDGDAEHPNDPEYRNMFYLRARSPRRPGIVDAKLEPITDHSAIYSGVYGRASITFYPYRFGENAGIGCRLNNLQKISDGEYLGGPSAKADFE